MLYTDGNIKFEAVGGSGNSVTGSQSSIIAGNNNIINVNSSSIIAGNSVTNSEPNTALASNLRVSNSFRCSSAIYVAGGTTTSLTGSEYTVIIRGSLSTLATVINLGTSQASGHHLYIRDIDTPSGTGTSSITINRGGTDFIRTTGNTVDATSITIPRGGDISLLYMNVPIIGVTPAINLWVQRDSASSHQMWNYLPEVGGSTTLALNSLFPTSTSSNVVFPLNEISTEGAGTKFIFDVAKGAIRGGKTTSTTWSDANRGVSSCAWGDSNTASGSHSGCLSGRLNMSSGTHGVVAGGENNTSAGGTWNSILGGTLNQILGSSGCSVIGGASNTISATATNSAICCGNVNSISGSNSIIGAGFTNSISAGRAAIIGGSNNNVSGFESCILAGSANNASGANSCILTGISNVASGIGSCALAGSVNVASGLNSSVLCGGNNTAGGSNSSVISGTALGNFENNTALTQNLRISNLLTFSGNQFYPSAGGVSQIADTTSHMYIRSSQLGTGLITLQLPTGPRVGQLLTIRDLDTPFGTATGISITATTNIIVPSFGDSGVNNIAMSMGGQVTFVYMNVPAMGSILSGLFWVQQNATKPAQPKLLFSVAPSTPTTTVYSFPLPIGKSVGLTIKTTLRSTTGTFAWDGSVGATAINNAGVITINTFSLVRNGNGTPSTSFSLSVVNPFSNTISVLIASSVIASIGWTSITIFYI